MHDRVEHALVTGDEVPCPRILQRTNHPLIGDRIITERDVAPYRVVEEVRLLWHVSDLLTPRAQVDVLHRDAIDVDIACRGTTQPGDEIEDRGLAAAGSADQRRDTAGRNADGKVIEDEKVADRKSTRLNSSHVKI